MTLVIMLIIMLQSNNHLFWNFKKLLKVFKFTVSGTGDVYSVEYLYNAYLAEN